MATKNIQDTQKPIKFFLVDYELLYQRQTGLDLIEKIGIVDNSILVTPRYEDEKISTRFEKLKVKLIPKAMACFVPLKEEKLKVKYDCVMIDEILSTSCLENFRESQ